MDLGEKKAEVEVKVKLNPVIKSKEEKTVKSEEDMSVQPKNDENKINLKKGAEENKLKETEPVCPKDLPQSGGDKNAGMACDKKIISEVIAKKNESNNAKKKASGGLDTYTPASKSTKSTA